MGHAQHSPRWICDELMNVDKGLVRDELSFEPDPWKSIQVEIFVRAAMMGDQTIFKTTGKQDYLMSSLSNADIIPHSGFVWRNMLKTQRFVYSTVCKV